MLLRRVGWRSSAAAALFSSNASDDGTPPSMPIDNTKLEQSSNSDHTRHLQDVTDYYSQYIEEYYSPVTSDVASIPVVDTTPAISLMHGKSGVFDVHELVELLRSERALDIVCIRMPAMAAIADHLIICTAFNARHSVAVVAAVRRYYWLKRHNDDMEIVRTVDTDKRWHAIDVGNVQLHVMDERVCLSLFIK